VPGVRGDGGVRGNTVPSEGGRSLRRQSQAGGMMLVNADGLRTAQARATAHGGRHTCDYLPQERGGLGPRRISGRRHASRGRRESARSITLVVAPPRLVCDVRYLVRCWGHPDPVRGVPPGVRSGL
jgi:hypothetical protein